MEILVSGRHTYVPEAFRETAIAKLQKVASIAEKTQTVQVEISHENNPKLAELRLRVEITVFGSGPIVRAEAAASEALSALDIAAEKLYERLRRSHDKAIDRRSQHVAKETDHNLANKAFDAAALEKELKHEAAEAKKPISGPEVLNSLLKVGESIEARLDDASPVTVRRKVHATEKLTTEQALERMELLGHDFYLFVHAATGRSTLLYRRHGWSYGTIELG